MKLPLAISSLVLLLSAFPVGAAEPPPDTKEIERLITQLGSEDFDTRQTASEKLNGAGESTLEALHRAATGPNAEVAFRAQKAIVAIQKTLSAPLKVMEGKQGRILCVAFDKESKKLAAGSYDGSIRVCEVATGKELLRLEGHKDIVFSVVFCPDGEHLLSCSGGTWNKGIWGATIRSASGASRPAKKSDGSGRTRKTG